MRFLFIFFLSILSLNSVAQTKSGLSSAEVNIAKQKFEAMMETDTYIKLHENIITVNKKLNGVKPIELKKLSKIEDINDLKHKLKIHLAPNIKKTDFKSVDEAVDEIIKNALLTHKLITDNKEVYDLIRRATTKQRIYITEAERENPYDIMYGTGKY
ncbi:hypothetical protein GWA97_07600 [Flavobacterium sp. LaA7.5]|nr:hypothetical protein [Flavobacterium salilacus subsp. altitudinum]